MEITLTLSDLMTILLGFAGFVLLIFLVIAVAKLITVLKSLNTTLTSTNKVLSDAEVITSIAAGKAEQADKIVDDMSFTLSNITSNIRGNQSTISALTSLVNSAGALKSIFSDSGEKGGKKSGKNKK